MGTLERRRYNNRLGEVLDMKKRKALGILYTLLVKLADREYNISGIARSVNMTFSVAKELVTDLENDGQLQRKTVDNIEYYFLTTKGYDTLRSLKQLQSNVSPIVWGFIS